MVHKMPACKEREREREFSCIYINKVIRGFPPFSKVRTDQAGRPQQIHFGESMEGQNEGCEVMTFARDQHQNIPSLIKLKELFPANNFEGICSTDFKKHI